MIRRRARVVDAADEAQLGALWQRALPAPEVTSVVERSSVDVHRMVDSIVAGRPIARPGRPLARPHHRRRIPLVAAAVVLAGGGVAWAALHSDRPADTTLIVCHRMADMSGDEVTLTRTISDPIAGCTNAWGTEKWGVPPPLVGCVARDSRIVVLPATEEDCTTLGMAPLDPAPAPDEAGVNTFVQSLRREIGDGACLPPDDVVKITRQRLADARLTGWNVAVVGAYTPQAPCGSLDIDVENRRIEVRPLPDRTRKVSDS